VDPTAAKTAITALQRRIPTQFTLAYANRAIELIDDPDKVNQGYYGTCGPTAALRALLLHDRAKFVNLTTAVFDPAHPVFNGITASSQTLLDARLAEIARKRALYEPAPHPEAYKDDFDLDFILASSLYTFLQKANDRVYADQRYYSESIVRLVSVDADQIVVTTLSGDHSAALNAGNKKDPDLIAALDTHSDHIASRLGYRLDGLRIKDIGVLAGLGWTVTFQTDRGDRQFFIEPTPSGFRLVARVAVEAGGIGFATGDLALDQDGIKALMHDVVGVRSVTLAKRSAPNVDDSVRRVLQQTGPNDHFYVFGLVKAYDEWNAAAESVNARTFNRPAKPPAKIERRPAPEIEHHLVILGITKSGDYNDVEVWSWAKRFTVRIRADFMSSYIYGYLHGQVTG